MVPWCQSPCWLNSSECHHLCWLLVDISKWPCSRPGVPADLLAKFVAEYLKPQLLAVGCADGYLRVVSEETGESLVSKHLSGGALRSVTYSPLGKSIAVGCADLCVVDAESGATILRKQFANGAVKHVSYSPCGRRLAVACVAVHIVDATSAETVGDMSMASGSALTLSYAPDGSKLAVGCDSGTLCVVDTKSNALIPRLEQHFAQSPVVSVCYTPGGESLLAGCHNGHLAVISAESGQVQRTIESSIQPLASIALSPCGSQLAACFFDAGKREPRVCHPTCKEEEDANALKLGTTVESSCSLAFSPCRRHLAMGCLDGHLRIIHARTGDIISDTNFTPPYFKYSAVQRSVAGSTAVWSVAYAPCA